ncbi:Molybdenum transport ATP-binding protein ModC [Caenispirillum salinarum AK4]|uniref:Molybdenum transport ATP-binding protein ModC n=1 Tax=Caenispirillum salinarum AK4 TaxID=1238182 RepID=K9H3B3_9PROT|nr:molybdenum ABC transporter ATP-binding protein [Caenispirillum salinarum]EKV32047.1 Molybdenum transport ATP-binding protein ModC [Caenispirillum salinarum AK4]
MLDVSVRKRQGDFLVDAAFNSPAAGVTALFGRSGSGKTSVINMVAGLSRPDEGRIAVNEAALFDSAARIDLPMDRRRCGYVFQDGRLFPHMTVRANLTYGMKLVPAARRVIAFDDVVGMLGIGHLLDRRPARLSGGEKQRVAIGRALLTSPRLLLMDEPLAALDETRKGEVLPFIADLPRHFAIPVLYVSHSLDEILRLADTLVLMDGGKAVAAGPVEDVVGALHLSGAVDAAEAGAVLTTTVEAHDPAHHMTLLAFPGGRLSVRRMDLPVGAAVRVRIRAGEVGIGLSPPRDTSFQNVFPAVIRDIGPPQDGQVDVRLDAGCTVWARITTRALETMSLRPGQVVHALVKSVALTRADVAGHEAPPPQRAAG